MPHTTNLQLYYAEVNKKIDEALYKATSGMVGGFVTGAPKNLRKYVYPDELRTVYVWEDGDTKIPLVEVKPMEPPKMGFNIKQIGTLMGDPA